MKKDPTREDWITIAKGIAILTVVLGHVEMFGFTRIPLAFQIPLFAIISGLTFKNFDSLSSFIKKKSILYLIPYVVASIVSIFIWFLIHTHNIFLSTTSFTFANILQPVLLGLNPIHNAPLWFLPAFLIAQIIWAIYFKYFIKVKENIVLIISSIILNFILGVLIHILFKNYYNSVLMPYSVDLAFMLAGFIGVGVMIKNKINSNNNSVLAFVLLVCSFVIGTYVNGDVNFFGREFNSISLFIANSITGSIIVLYISKYIEVYAKNIFMYLKKLLLIFGEASLIIMLYHWPALLILNALMFNSGLFTMLHADQTLVTMVLPYKRDIVSMTTKLFYFSFYTTWAIVGAYLLGKPLQRVTKKLTAAK